jgi:hypothetical protein
MKEGKRKGNRMKERVEGGEGGKGVHRPFLFDV